MMGKIFVGNGLNIDENPGGPALTAGHPFTGIQSDYYWSSTTYAGDTSDAWVMALYGFVGKGYMTEAGRMFSYSVWPVRGER